MGLPVRLVKVTEHDGGMTTWFRTYDQDLWLYFEVDEEGWATRQVEVRGKVAAPDGGLIGGGRARA
jgi:hypothetical protein